MYRLLVPLFACLLLGCQMPAQMVWSPDGSKAAYRVGTQMVLIDADGKLISPRIQSTGGMAWTADSKTVYLAEIFDATEGQKERTEIFAWNESGEKKQLFALPGWPVWHMALSPDQNWLAVIQQASDQSTDCVLHAFHLPSSKLVIVSGLCGVGMCFTGPSRLAFIEPESKAITLKGAAGHIVEVTLGDGMVASERKKLVNVRSDETAWIRPIGDDLLFTATSLTYPSRATTRPTTAKLFHYSRADGGLCSIAEEVGPLFNISPDGKQVLIEKVAPGDGKSTQRELVVIRPNGSDARVLRDLTSTNDMPMWPSWRGNAELVMHSMPDKDQPLRVDADNAVRFEVVVYRLTEIFELQPIRTLSQDWPAELKPNYRVKSPTTAPTTAPTTQAVSARRAPIVP